MECNVGKADKKVPTKKVYFDSESPGISLYILYSRNFGEVLNLVNLQKIAE